MILNAAGITSTLTAAGYSPAQLHEWFGTPLAELTWLSPRQYLDLLPTTFAGERVLELARAELRLQTTPTEEATHAAHPDRPL